MGRPVVLSNGRMFVGLDENGLVHDFYYPYVGLENLTNARSSVHKIGVWADGEFSWVDDGSWQVNVDFEDKALVSAVSMQNTDLGITIESEDFIDEEYNAFIRRLRVKNLRDHKRDIRLFMHQVFQISRAGRADTILYVPDDHYLLDYKGRCCLVIAGKFVDGGDYDQYAAGNYQIEGKDGTFRDAEDGVLSDNPVESGGVDSVIRFSRELEGNASYEVDYWVIAADSQSDAQVVHTYLKHYDLSARLISVRDSWQEWLSPVIASVARMPEEHQRAITKSLLIIKAHIDNRGSILASGDSSLFNYSRDYYCYCWPRDAAYALWPMIRLGLFEEAKKFFEFARDTMHHDGYMMHKYQPDRSIGSTWHPLIHNRAKELAIQEDETASVLIMLGQFYLASHDIEFIDNFYDNFIAPCANFMTYYYDPKTKLPHASYDLWEEKFLTTTYSTTTVIAALETAAEFAKLTSHPNDEAIWKEAAEKYRGHLGTFFKDGYLAKGYLLQSDGSLDIDSKIDISSLYGAFRYSGLPIDDYRIQATAKKVKEVITDSSPIGGVVRYDKDFYLLSKKQYLGNPWAVCTLWLAQYCVAIGDKRSARQYIDWTLQRRLHSGMLSEQYDPEDGLMLGVAPLVWSHSELITTLLDFYDF